MAPIWAGPGLLKYNSSLRDVHTVNEILRKEIRFLKPSSTIHLQ